ncbi:MAG: Kelch repeat-containing protein [Phycisphaerales bacterium]
MAHPRLHAHLSAIVASALLIHSGDVLSEPLIHSCTHGEPRAMPITVSQPPAQDQSDLPLFLGRWNAEELDSPPLPVFDATVTYVAGNIVVMGGFTHDLQATPAVQIHHPTRGWAPIGSQLSQARARHTLTPLADGRVLIVGGVTTTSNDGSIELVPLASCEVLNPLVAGSSLVESLDEPLTGHTTHLLNDNSVAVVGGKWVHIFDPESRTWVEHIELAHERCDHASILLRDGRLLIIGGQGCAAIEVVDLDGELHRGTRVSTLWKEQLPVPLSGCSAIELRDGRVLIAGGFNEQRQRTIDSMLFVNVKKRIVEQGPRLALQHGICSAQLDLDPDGRAVILGGEWRTATARGPANAVRLYDPIRNQLWRLPPLPNDCSRRAWFRNEASVLHAWGGYRFLNENDAAITSESPGIHLNSQHLTLIMQPLPRLID